MTAVESEETGLSAAEQVFKPLQLTASMLASSSVAAISNSEFLPEESRDRTPLQRLLLDLGQEVKTARQRGLEGVAYSDKICSHVQILILARH
jgi:hypothetical protein